MTYQDFVNNMPENSILMCYIQGNNFSPNSTDGCALFVKCTGSAGSKKIIFETTSMSGASSEIYRARYSAAAGTKWTGWIQIPTNTQLDTKLAKSDVANNLTTTASGKALDARQGKILNDKFGDIIKIVRFNSVLTFTNGKATYKTSISGSGSLFYVGVCGAASVHTFTCSITNGNLSEAAWVIRCTDAAGISESVNIRMFAVIS